MTQAPAAPQLRQRTSARLRAHAVLVFEFEKRTMDAGVNGGRTSKEPVAPQAPVASVALCEKE
jgi:hypothetical protein